MSLLKQRLEQNGIKSSEDTNSSNANNSTTNSTDKNNSENRSQGEGQQNTAGSNTGNTGEGNTAVGGSAPNNTSSQTSPGQTSPGGEENKETIEDAVLLRELQKRGINAQSLADLNKPAPASEKVLTDEEKKALAERRQNEVTQFGLAKGKITKVQIDRFAVDSAKDPIELSFEIFRKEKLAELKAGNVPKEELPTEDALYQEFSDYNYLELAENDPKRVRREKELIAQADSYLKNTYKPLYDLEREFEDHTNGVQTRTGYSTKVDTAISKIPTELVFPVPDIADKSGKTMLSYKYKPLPQTINALKEKYGSEGMFNLLGKGELSEKDLADSMLNEVKLLEFDRILSEVAHSHATAELEKHQRGRRNIIDTPGTDGNGAPVQSSPIMKKLLDENKNLLQQN